MANMNCKRTKTKVMAHTKFFLTKTRAMVNMNNKMTKTRPRQW
jgi:hypothetical protein